MGKLDARLRRLEEAGKAQELPGMLFFRTEEDWAQWVQSFIDRGEMVPTEVKTYIGLDPDLI
jgi:hypothetical protein